MPICNFKRVCKIAAGFCDILSRMALFAFFIFFYTAKCVTFDLKVTSNEKFLLGLGLLLSFPAFAQVSVDGGCYRRVDTSTGLSAVYVVKEAGSVSMRYASSSTDAIYWFRFDASGVSSRTEMLGTQSGNLSSLVSPYADCGYMVKQGSDSLCFWVASYRPVLSCGVAETQENVCVSVLLTGEGFAIPYYTTLGQRENLSRWVSYTTSVWDAAALAIIEQVPVTAEAEVLNDTEMEIPRSLWIYRFYSCRFYSVGVGRQCAADDVGGV